MISSALAAPVRVACVGDSITYGAGAPKNWAYPDQLGRILGSGYDLRNFGVSGTTMLRHGDFPYDVRPEFKAALAFKPDILILMLGTNDTKSQNWGTHSAEFEGDYRWMVGQFQAVNPSMKIFLCRPPWVVGKGGYGIKEAGVESEIPIIDRIASSMNTSLIDMHVVLLNHPEYLPDNVHPNQAGAALMAKAAYKAVTGKDYVGQVPPPAAPSAPKAP
ncbi:MAG TPA: GDSL-type esterase/lipase family protein [Chthoniobacteraceae bacterium]|nr:GDSL-type esterase/lipase family protein [Chthoniobacteraceae bacterium]